MRSREAENRSGNTLPTHRRYAVNDMVVGIGMPCAVNLGIGFVWTGCERKDGERPSLIGHEEAVFVRDVFFSINATRIPVGPLSHIPIRLHESAGMLIRALDELEVVKGSDLNLHLPIIRELTPYRVPCLSPTVDSLVLVGSDQANVFQGVCTVQDLSIKCGEA